MKSINTSFPLVLLLVFSSLTVIADISVLSALNYFLFSLIFVRLVNRLGQEIPIRELTSFVLALQMIISPIVVYHFFDNKIGYKMDIPEDHYLSMITPLVYSLIVGLFLPISKRKIELNTLFSSLNQNNLVTYGWYFLGIGIFFNLTINIFPQSLKFIFTILGYFQFLGIFCLFFSKYKYRNIVVILVYGLFFLNAIRTGMFYGAIVWGFFLVALFFIKYKTKTLTKVLILFMGFISLLVIQAIKKEYRKTITQKKEVNKVEVFYSSINEKLEAQPISEDKEALERFIERVNTGHITAKVFKHTPSKQNFADGKELASDLVSVLLPRFLFPNKKSVGGEDNSKKFFKYTGRVLNDTTIMRIGVIGDAYINFGLIGGCILLFLFGLLLNLLISWLIKYSFAYPVLILWLPIIFTYVVRMSDFIVLINSVVKILVVLFIFLLGFPNWFLFQKKYAKK